MSQLVSGLVMMHMLIIQHNCLSFGGGSQPEEPKPRHDGNADNPNQINAEGEDLHLKYSKLVQLGQHNSGVEVRGIGKCLGDLYFFLNQPFAYFGGQDIFFNPSSGRFIITSLDPSKLVSYSKNTELMQYVCDSGVNCHSLATNIYMAVHTIGNECLFYVVDMRYNTDKTEHELPSFKMDRSKQQISFAGKERHSGLKGIAFSTCGVMRPQIRFLYYGKLIVTDQCNQTKFQDLVSQFPGKDKRQQCYKEIKNQENVPRQDNLMLTSDNCYPNEPVWRQMNDVLNKYSFKFGACIDSRYLIVTVANIVMFKDYIMINRYNYFGFIYNLFSERTESCPMEYFFSVYVLPPKVVDRETTLKPGDSTKSKAEGGKQKEEKGGGANVKTTAEPTVETEIGTAWILSIYTDAPPNDVGDDFTGMPEKSVKVKITYVVPVKPTEYFLFKKYAIYLAIAFFIGTLIFCCILCFCASRRRRHAHRAAKAQTVIVSMPKPSTRTTTRRR